MKARTWVLATILLVAPLLLSAWALRSRAAQAAPPRLAVLVVFDQLRGDYVPRWEKLFGDGGFRRLRTAGAWFENCHYPYANTETGPGHASLLTGCSANRHGIITNTWYDRDLGKSVYCATTERYDPVPPYERKKGDTSAGSPERRLVPTLADVLKEASGGKGRVVSLSFKDRSAIMSAGRKPDACYWVHGDTATFGTSTYYRDRPHDWVVQFNASKFGERWLGKQWEKLRPDLDYEKYSGRDDVAAEGVGSKQGRTFPHPFAEGATAVGKDYYQALYNSPFGNEVLLELVKRAIVAEGLGTRDTPDLLCVSFSCNDPVGHVWGPDSQEVLDTTLRTDLLLKEFLTFLDDKVGQDRYVLALSADHGVAPLPEMAAAQGKEAARLALDPLKRKLEMFAQEKFGAGDDKFKLIESVAPPGVYLNQKLLAERGLKSATVEEAVADWLKEQPGVQTAYTRTQLLQGLPAADPIGQRVWRSFHPQRSGDVILVVKPYYQVTSYLTGTGHGTPHPYDTHVPLAVFGNGVRPGLRMDAVTPQACAAILAHALRLQPPPAAEAPLPEKLFVTP
jgi:predicted AlkP superfamily pyrophosphatase or phosphodiesterase